MSDTQFSARRTITAVATVVTVIFVCIGLTASFWPLNKPTTPPAPAAESADTLKPKFDAILRTYVTNLVCYDQSLGSFLIYITKGTVNGDGDAVDPGWFLITEPMFRTMGNGTMLVDDRGYEKIWPDVTGLHCSDK
jgi:hypothetical protein